MGSLCTRWWLLLLHTWWYRQHTTGVWYVHAHENAHSLEQPTNANMFEFIFIIPITIIINGNARRCTHDFDAESSSRCFYLQHEHIQSYVVVHCRKIAKSIVRLWLTDWRTDDVKNVSASSTSSSTSSVGLLSLNWIQYHYFMFSEHLIASDLHIFELILTTTCIWMVESPQEKTHRKKS